MIELVYSEGFIKIYLIDGTMILGWVIKKY